jgi:preprotein translocase subunit SecG
MIFNIITIISMALLTLFILIQSRGASLGAGFGGSSEIYTTRRGVDRTIYQITIILAIIFVASIIFGLLLA